MTSLPKGSSRSSALSRSIMNVELPQPQISTLCTSPQPCINYYHFLPVSLPHLACPDASISVHPNRLLFHYQSSWLLLAKGAGIWEPHLRLVTGGRVLKRQHVQACALVGRVGTRLADDPRLPREACLPLEALLPGAHDRDGDLVVAPLHIAGRVPSSYGKCCRGEKQPSGDYGHHACLEQRQHLPLQSCICRWRMLGAGAPARRHEPLPHREHTKGQ